VQGQAAQESTGRVVVLGNTSLDLQPEDRFNDGAGNVYRVLAVRPNRRAGIIAEAVGIQ
jgi:hypothetical protein